MHFTNMHAPILQTTFSTRISPTKEIALELVQKPHCTPSTKYIVRLQPRRGSQSDAEVQFSLVLAIILLNLELDLNLEKMVSRTMNQN